jgi:hypothetical protein
LTQASPPPVIVLSPRIVRNTLLAILAGLVAIDFLLVLFEYGLHVTVPSPIADRLDSNVEASLPTLFNVELLFLAALATAFTAAIKPPHRWTWWLLTAVFCYLAVDESLSIHEGIGPRVRDILHTTGIFYVAWIIPYAIACVLLFLLILPWLRDLPGPTQRGVIVSAFVYLAGAMVMDAASGAYLTRYDLEPDVVHALMTGVEEGLEMLGVTLFIYFVLRYAGSRMETVALRIRDTG